MIIVSVLVSLSSWHTKLKCWDPRETMFSKSSFRTGYYKGFKSCSNWKAWDVEELFVTFQQKIRNFKNDLRYLSVMGCLAWWNAASLCNLSTSPYIVMFSLKTMTFLLTYYRCALISRYRIEAKFRLQHREKRKFPSMLNVEQPP